MNRTEVRFAFLFQHSIQVEISEQEEFRMLTTPLGQDSVISEVPKE